MITVFTPTYNRGGLLNRLYESLKRQTYKEFEWIVVDDGSTDETRSVVENFKQEASFPIKYLYTINGGKHRAINKGVQMAQGELFFIADSDDWLLEDSLEIVAKQSENIKNKEQFGGICGVDISPSGHIIGSGLPSNIIDTNTMDIRYKFGVKGDLKEVFYTRVLKEFPFPEIDCENFCPEDLVWSRIATKYQLRFINLPIYVADYQEKGLSSMIVEIRMKSPVASMMTYLEMLDYNIPLSTKFKCSINYWRFWCCRNKKSVYPKMPLRWRFCAPIGILMHLRDLHYCKS